MADGQHLAEVVLRCRQGGFLCFAHITEGSEFGLQCVRGCFGIQSRLERFGFRIWCLAKTAATATTSSSTTTTAAVTTTTPTATEAAIATRHCLLGLNYLLNQGLKSCPLVDIGNLQARLGIVQAHLQHLCRVHIPSATTAAATTAAATTAAATLGQYIPRSNQAGGQARR